MADWARHWGVTAIAVAVAVFCLGIVLVTLDDARHFDPLTYTIQRVVRTDSAGVVTVPVIDGFDGPAVHVGDRVPVSGELDVDATYDISVAGTVFWQEHPPGERFEVARDVPYLLNPGARVLVFENPIPDDVAAFVRQHGPRQFTIRGRVEVLEPGGVAATWETESFWIVP